MDPEKRAKLLRRTRVGGSLALGAALFLVLAARSSNGLPVFIVGLVMASLGARELAGMGELRAWRLGPALVAALVAAFTLAFQAVAPRAAELPWLVTAWPAALLAQAGVIGGAALATALVLRSPQRSPLLAALLALWCAAPLAWALHVWRDHGDAGLVSLIVLSKIGDIAGYYVGSTLGRTHPFPRLSPGKTTAGCVGSLVVGVAAALALDAGGWLPVVGAGAAAIFGALVNLSAQAGDLAESWVKRSAGVKDSGLLFGPSGGVLDVVDSLLFTVPAALLCASWLS